MRVFVCTRNSSVQSIFLGMTRMQQHKKCTKKRFSDALIEKISHGAMKNTFVMSGKNGPTNVHDLQNNCFRSAGEKKRNAGTEMKSNES